MADREKIIKGLEMCRVGHCDYRCPYASINVGCKNQLLDDAMNLLKEQEEEIENLKQTAQSMMEGICLLKEQECR